MPPLQAETDARLSHLRRGWYWGKQAFAEKLLKIGDKVLQQKRERSYRASQEGQAHDLRRAEDLLRRGLLAAGLNQKDLAEIPGADPRKMALASLIWSETTASQKWLAEKLSMSSAPNVSQILRRWKQQPLLEKLPPKLQAFLAENTASKDGHGKS